MGYFSELDIELQNHETDEREFNWQAEQAADEAEILSFSNSGSVVVPSDILELELDDPFNEFGYADFNRNIGPEELRHIEAQAEIQENIHNGYGE